MLKLNAIGKIHGRKGRRLARKEIAAILTGKPRTTSFLFRDISAEVGAGDRLAIVGESNSGKSSLLNIMAGLDRPSAGVVTLNGSMAHRLSARRRRRTVRFVAANSEMLNDLSVEKNLKAFSAQFAAKGQSWKNAVTPWNLQTLAARLPGSLSQAERVRLLLARTFIGRPELVFIDGLLDGRPAAEQADLIAKLQDEQERNGCAIVLATAELGLARRFAGEKLIALSETSEEAVTDAEVSEAVQPTGLDVGVTVQDAMHIPPIIRLGAATVSATLEQMGASGTHFAAVVTENEEFAGLLSRHDLSVAISTGGNIAQMIERPKALQFSEQVSDHRRLILEEPLPVAVIDREENLLGLIAAKDLVPYLAPGS